MEIVKNPTFQILKSMTHWIPLAFVSVFSYWAMIAAAMIWGLENFFDYELDAARVPSLLASAILVTLGAAYLSRRSLRNMQKLRIEIADHTLIIYGRFAWRFLDESIPLSSIERVTIGEPSSKFEAFSSGHALVQDIINSKVTIWFKQRKPLNLPWVGRIFDNNSLYDFFRFLNAKGVATNVRT